MAYIIRDTNPQYGGQCYFVGTRKIHDPNGRAAEAADFGDMPNSKKFTNKRDADEIARNLNKIAGNANQFSVDEISIYNQQYGKRRTNGFSGFGELPIEEPVGGFVWHEPSSGYNGF
mgnify:CR=1 FL=1